MERGSLPGPLGLAGRVLVQGALFAVLLVVTIGTLGELDRSCLRPSTVAFVGFASGASLVLFEALVRFGGSHGLAIVGAPFFLAAAVLGGALEERYLAGALGGAGFGTAPGFEDLMVDPSFQRLAGLLVFGAAPLPALRLRSVAPWAQIFGLGAWAGLLGAVFSGLPDSATAAKVAQRTVLGAVVLALLPAVATLVDAVSAAASGPGRTRRVLAGAAGRALTHAAFFGTVAAVVFVTTYEVTGARYDDGCCRDRSPPSVGFPFLVGAALGGCLVLLEMALESRRRHVGPSRVLALASPVALLAVLGAAQAHRHLAVPLGASEVMSFHHPYVADPSFLALAGFLAVGAAPLVVLRLARVDVGVQLVGLAIWAGLIGRFFNETGGEPKQVFWRAVACVNLLALLPVAASLADRTWAAVRRSNPHDLAVREVEDTDRPARVEVVAVP